MSLVKEAKFKRKIRGTFLLTKLYTTYFKKCKDENCSQKLQSSRVNYSAKRERAINAVRGTLMKCCACGGERKACFQKFRVRVKTIKHYTKDRKRR